MGLRRKFLQSFNHGVVGVQIAEVLPVPAIELARLDVKDINQDADLGEDVGFLGGEIVFCKGVLAWGKSVRRKPRLE